MVTDALRRVMVAARGAGELAPGGGVSHGAAEHPICGDVLELDCRIEDGQLVDLAWRAQGCPASMAVAAAAATALCGQPVARAESVLRQRLAELGGLAATENHALALFLRAFHRAVRG